MRTFSGKAIVVDLPQEAQVRRAKVLIADDYWLFRQMMRALVEANADFQVTGEAASLREAVHLARYYPPDLIVIGLRMLTSQQEASLARFPYWSLSPWASAKLVVVGDTDLPEYAELARKRGATTYMCREALPSTLVATLLELYRNAPTPQCDDGDDSRATSPFPRPAAVQAES